MYTTLVLDLSFFLLLVSVHTIVVYHLVVIQFMVINFYQLYKYFECLIFK